MRILLRTLIELACPLAPALDHSDPGFNLFGEPEPGVAEYFKILKSLINNKDTDIEDRENSKIKNRDLEEKEKNRREYMKN
jgi:hypothetical protein